MFLRASWSVHRLHDFQQSVLTDQRNQDLEIFLCKSKIVPLQIGPSNIAQCVNAESDIAQVEGGLNGGFVEGNGIFKLTPDRPTNTRKAITAQAAQKQIDGDWVERLDILLEDFIMTPLRVKRNKKRNMGMTETWRSP
jgi:hypothetical protein